MKNNTFKILVSSLMATMVVGQGVVCAEVPVTKTAPYIQYHNRMSVFSPSHLAYERIKNDDLYAAVEGWLTHRIGGHGGLLGDAEFRMGYNYFYNGRDHITPFAGVGVFKDYHKIHGTEYTQTSNGQIETSQRTFRRAAVGYGTVGFKYCHEFNSIFNLGADLKVLVGGSIGPNSQERWGATVYGFDLAIPFTFRFGKDRHWDVRIEPFDTYLRGSEITSNYFGFRNTIGYRF